MSHELVAWKRVTIRTRCRQRVHLIQHAFIRSRASSRGYTFGVRPFRTDQVLSGSRRSLHVRRGSSCTHAIVEVVVLSFISDHQDGSRNRGTRRLVENHGGDICTRSMRRRSFGVRLAGLADMSGTWCFCVDELGASEGSHLSLWELGESEVFEVDGSCTSHSGT